MADVLHSIVMINDQEYEVSAKTAEKVIHQLTIKSIKDGKESTEYFDGSEAKTIEIGDANKIKVEINPDTDKKEVTYAPITISENDPVASSGSTGNIWFKYN